jgi:hypothetical protein
MHSGEYTMYDKDIFFSLILPYKKLKSNFVGSSQNNIEAGSLKIQMKAFTVSQIKDVCPSEKINLIKKSSFITSSTKELDNQKLDELITLLRTVQGQNHVNNINNVNSE